MSVSALEPDQRDPSHSWCVVCKASYPPGRAGPHILTKGHQDRAAKLAKKAASAGEAKVDVAPEKAPSNGGAAKKSAPRAKKGAEPVPDEKQHVHFPADPARDAPPPAGLVDDPQVPGNAWCAACRQSVPKGRGKLHVDSQRHKQAVEKEAAAEKRRALAATS